MGLGAGGWRSRLGRGDGRFHVRTGRPHPGTNLIWFDLAGFAGARALVSARGGTDRLGGDRGGFAEGDEVAGEAAEGFELLVDGGGDFTVPMIEKTGVTGGQDGEELLGEMLAGFGNDGGGFAGGLEGAEDFLAEGPFGEGAGAPFAEVLRADRPAVELAGEDLPDLGQGIEPGEEGFGRLGVGEAVVELFADGVGETGDFAGGGHEGRGLRLKKLKS